MWKLYIYMCRPDIGVNDYIDRCVRALAIRDRLKSNDVEFIYYDCLTWLPNFVYRTKVI